MILQALLLELKFLCFFTSGLSKKRSRAHFGSTYTKNGMIQRRLAWPSGKDDPQIHEACHIFKKIKTVI